MKFIEKKCPNCGANMKFNLEDKEVKCNYCNSEFIIENNNEENSKVNLDKVNLKLIKTFSIIHLIVFIVVFCFIVGTFVLVFINFSKMTGDVNTRSNNVEIKLSDISDDVIKKLSNISKEEIRKWNGEDNNYEDVGFYYLKNKVSVEVVYVLKSTYLIDNESKEIYTTFSYYGSSINNLRYTPYITTELYKVDNFNIIHGYNSIQSIYDKLIHDKEALGFKVAASNNLYLEQ